jgi:uncharacterized membrane protein
LIFNQFSVIRLLDNSRRLPFSYGLDIRWRQALISDLLLMLFYLIYALFAQWAVDLICGQQAATLGAPANL